MSPGDPAVVHVVDSATLVTRSSGIGFVTLRATRTAAPLAGRSIDFTSGNRHLCTATTNSDGVASCQAFGPLGTYPASFAGEEHHLPSEDQDRFL